MAHASGYIRVETEIDIADYDGEYDIEFDSLADVIEIAELNNYTKEEIIDWCFDHGVDITNYMVTWLSTAQIIDIYTKAITTQMDEQMLTISNQRDRIKELEAELAEARKTDEEAVKGVAY
tara:strand:- start:1548 stop:1910 length:363 start_codon:yes stop_codon:yes gene_type:complete